MPDEQDRAEDRFDSLDRKLIAELQSDPRMPYAGLGARLGVTGMTAANRLHRLRDESLLHMEVVPNLAELGLSTHLLGLVQADVGALRRVADMLVGSPFVQRVTRVTGEFDITFEAAFQSETAIGGLIREIQTLDGVRRLVIHHRVQNVHEATGWDAVFESEEPEPEQEFELAPGVDLPHELVLPVRLAARWVNAVTAADDSTLEQLSTPDIVFTIEEPHPAAGTFDGIGQVKQQARRTADAYKRLWYRIVAVRPLTGNWSLVIDALSPVETRRGRVRTAFSRMAFAFDGDRVRKVRSIGAMELPESPPST